MNVTANGILSWTYHFFLRTYFGSDNRKMALALRVTESTLLKALEQEHSAESLLLFEQLMQYCSSNNVSIDDALKKYPQSL